MTNEPEFIKYPKILHLNGTLRILDNPVSVFEKLDGGNTQVRMCNGRLFAGSRAQFLTREERFRQPWFGDFKKWAMANYSFYKLPENLVVYGEFLAPHTLDYGDNSVNSFFVLDVLDSEKGRFLPYDVARKTLEQLGVEDVNFLDPLILNERVGRSQLYSLITESPYRDGGLMEGLVIKNYESDPQRFAKLWTSTLKFRDRPKGAPGELEYGDVRGIGLSLHDQGIPINQRILVGEVVREFKESGISLTKGAIKEYATRFFDETGIKEVKDPWD
tara:strand:- start:7301 stop:8122 length:822 start_codon:yes stop_codon:yes gene_type:complete